MSADESEVIVTCSEGDDTLEKESERHKRKKLSSGGSSEHRPSRLNEVKTEVKELKDFLKKIDNKLNGLDEIKIELSNVVKTVDRIWKKIDEVDNRCDRVEEKVDELDRKYAQLQETVMEQKRELDSSYEAFRALEDRSIDLEARSRRNNLVFYGLKEEGDEDCRKVIERLLNVQCGMKKPVVMERVHRTGGRPKQPGSTRPMIVKFLDYNDKMKVKALRDRLPNSVYVKDDLPWAVREAQKSLIDECKKARQQDRDAFIAFPARLIVDGQEVDAIRPCLNGQQTHHRRHDIRKGHNSSSKPNATEVSQTDRSEARAEGEYPGSSNPDNRQQNAWQTATRGGWRGRGRGRRGAGRGGFPR